VSSIEVAVASGDCDAVAAAAHGLKGSAATLGAPHLRDHTLAMELAGKNGDLDALRGRVDALGTSADATLAEFHARYPSAVGARPASG
jgi:HPt (histidine-containing phosphotransfer) domain-containing protein